MGNEIKIVKAICLDSEHWRIKYNVGSLLYDDVFKRVCHLEE